jgi:hypothetical protein
MKLKTIFSFFLIVQTSCLGVIPSSKDELTPVTYRRSEDKEPAKHPFIKAFQDPKTNLYGFKDQNNQIIIQPIYRSAYDFTIHNVADVQYSTHNVTKGWYQINTMGERLTKRYIFDNGPDYYRSGLSRFQKNGKVGFINRKGEIVVKADYDHANPFVFVQPIALACKGCVIEKQGCCDYKVKGGKWSVINQKGEKVIPMEFTDLSSTPDRSFVMIKDKKRYKIFINNKTGKYEAIQQ